MENKTYTQKLTEAAANGGILYNGTQAYSLRSFVDSLSLNTAERAEAARFFWAEYTKNNGEWYSYAAAMAIMSDFSLDADTASSIVDGWLGFRPVGEICWGEL